MKYRPDATHFGRERERERELGRNLTKPKAPFQCHKSIRIVLEGAGLKIRAPDFGGETTPYESLIFLHNIRSRSEGGDIREESRAPSDTSTCKYSFVFLTLLLFSSMQVSILFRCHDQWELLVLCDFLLSLLVSQITHGTRESQRVPIVDRVSESRTRSLSMSERGVSVQHRAGAISCEFQFHANAKHGYPELHNSQ